MPKFLKQHKLPISNILFVYDIIDKKNINLKNGCLIFKMKKK